MPNTDEGVKTETEEVSPPAPAEEVKTGVQDASTERDYRKELEEEQAKRVKVEEERDNYRKATLISKKKLRKETKNSDDEYDDEYDDTEEKISADDIADRVIQKIAPTLSQSVVDQEVGQYTQNADKRALIKFHYNNSIVKSGFDADAIRSDISKAIAIADVGRIRIERDEIARVALSNKTPSLSSSGHGSETEVKTNPYGWTQEQVKEINIRQNAINNRDATTKELAKAWSLSKSVTPGAELPPAKK